MWWFDAANKSTSTALLPLPPLPPCFRRFCRASAPPSFRRFHRSAPIISVMRLSTTRCRQDHRMPCADGSPAIDAIAVPRRRLHSPTPSDIVALLRRWTPSLSPAFVIRERCISRPPPSLTNDTGEAGGSVCVRSHVGLRREDPRKLPPAPALANDAAQRGDEGAGHTLFARVGDDYVTGNPPDFPGISQLMEPKLEVFFRTAAKRSGV